MTRLSAEEARRWRETRVQAHKKTAPDSLRLWAMGAKPGDTYLLSAKEIAENPTSPRYTYNWGRRYGLWISVEINTKTGERLYTKQPGPRSKRKP